MVSFSINFRLGVNRPCAVKLGQQFADATMRDPQTLANISGTDAHLCQLYYLDSDVAG